MTHAQSVLIVDNSRAMHALLIARLANEGLQFRSAFSGEEGLTLARECRPDLILLDIEMPDLDGFEVCRQLVADPATSAIPIIFLSALSSTAQKIKGLNLGAADYVTKPFEPAELLARVRASLRTKYLVDLLSRKAMLDGLTGLWNRAYFEQRLAASLSLATRAGFTFSCIMLDVDNFKSVNDNYGHPFGDTVLRRVAGAISRECRTEDIVARYGGEEFIVLTPTVAEPGALILAERLRKSIENEILCFNHNRVPITCSFGVADSRIASPAEIVQFADQALYHAKRTGKNRVVPRTHAGSPAFTPAASRHLHSPAEDTSTTTH